MLYINSQHAERREGRVFPQTLGAEGTFDALRCAKMNRFRDLAGVMFQKDVMPILIFFNTQSWILGSK